VEGLGWRFARLKPSLFRKFGRTGLIASNNEEDEKVNQRRPEVFLTQRMSLTARCVLIVAKSVELLRADGGRDHVITLCSSEARRRDG
jgi:hypothetical protein